VVYNIPCASCEDFYIGETARSLGKRFDEHRKTDKESALLEHIKHSGHSISFDDVSILANETNYNARKVKEALEIHKSNPTLNRDQGVEVPPVLLQLLKTSRSGPYNTSTGHPRVSPRLRTNSL
jgi:hypothetical protein